jgi:hypothetical protein
MAPDRVHVRGGTGRPRPDTVKVSIGYEDGFVGEGQISYAGPGAVARGQLALDVVRERLKMTGVPISDLRCELIGLNAIDRTGQVNGPEPREVRVRVAGRTPTRTAAERISAEVEALYTNGPFGGGGAVSSVREVLAVASTLLDRTQIVPSVQYEVA